MDHLIRKFIRLMVILGFTNALFLLVSGAFFLISLCWAMFGTTESTSSSWGNFSVWYLNLWISHWAVTVGLSGTIAIAAIWVAYNRKAINRLFKSI